VRVCVNMFVCGVCVSGVCCVCVCVCGVCGVCVCVCVCVWVCHCMRCLCVIASSAEY